MDESFYQKANTEAYTEEIAKLIKNKKERVGEFVQDWLKLETPYFDFIKAVCNLNTNDKPAFFDLLTKEIIQQEKVELIAPLLTFQIQDIIGFINKAIDYEKLNVLDYLLNEESFFIPSREKYEIYSYIWKSDNKEFVYEAEKLLTKNNITIDKRIFENEEKVNNLVSSIILSNQFEYILFIENKLNTQLEKKNIYNYDGYWERNLKDKSFYYLDTQTQSNFLDLFMKMDKQRDPLKILRKYFVLKNHNKAKPVDNEVFLEVFDNLINKGSLELEECQKYLDVCDYKNFFQDYEAYQEKKHLNKIVNVIEKESDKKLKI
jgi:polyhydroxyalkanoate synthesis regulator phasin